MSEVPLLFAEETYGAAEVLARAPVQIEPRYMTEAEVQELCASFASDVMLTSKSGAAIW